MAQTWTADSFNPAHDWDDDMQAIENNLLALQSSFSGTGAPTSPVAGQLWYDTDTDTLKRYDTTWLAVLQGDSNFKIPVYRNDTNDGWLIDATVTDRVITLKGGTGAYNANGGTNAGETWANLKAHTHAAGSYSAAAHNHMWLDTPSAASVGDSSFDSGGNASAVGTRTATGGSYITAGTGGKRLTDADRYTNNASPSLSGTSAAQSTSDVRPQAALCTLQYPDLT